jgi:signal transduction histidine kinase
MDSVRSVRTLAEKRNIKVHFSELPEMPLKADESLLHRLFLNLLDNAIKYNRENGKISIAAKNVGNKYQITISDTGIGIPPEKQTKIFDRFYRADEARSHNNENISAGAGLGLSIASWIAKIHGGNLTLEQSNSKGSVFQLELPC